MYKARYSVHSSFDALCELDPDAAAYIKNEFQDYRGKIYGFIELEDFGLYEMTEGSFANVINFDSPGVRPINLESAIDFYELGSNILEAGLINVIYYDGWIYVLPDLK